MEAPASPRRARWWRGAAVLGLALLWVLVVGDIPGPGRLRGVQAAAHPYRFNLTIWTATRLAGVLPRPPPPGGPQAMESYFRLAAELSAAEAAVVRAQALAPAQEGGALLRALGERDRVRREMAEVEPGARRELGRLVGEALRGEGLFPRLPGGRPVSFPPVAFALEETPRALVVSPRERIELQELVHLRADITDEEAAALEEALARRGLSALVEPLGGLSTYPAIVAPTSDLRTALAAIAHEWTHHYLFFRPLGQRYGEGGGMATINETAANMVGDEVAALQLGEPPPALRPPPPPAPPRALESPPGFDARRLLQETRREAERLLAAGGVEEAEALMEARRRELAEHGIFLRRLNQAYFAFHGTYADSPASVSPVFDQLVAVRRAEPSLGAFLRTVARVQSPEELEALARATGGPSAPRSP